MESGDEGEVNSRQLKVEGKSRTFLEAIQFFWRARAASRRGRGSQKAAGRQLLVLRCKLLVLGTAEKCLTQSSRRAQRTRSGKQRRKLIQSIHGTGHSSHFSSFALPPGAAAFGSIPSNSPAILPLATPAAPRGSPPLHTF